MARVQDGRKRVFFDWKECVLALERLHAAIAEHGLDVRPFAVVEASDSPQFRSLDHPPRRTLDLRLRHRAAVVDTEEGIPRRRKPSHRGPQFRVIDAAVGGVEPRRSA